MVAHELNVIAIREDAKRMNNSFFMLVFFKSYRVIKNWYSKEGWKNPIIQRRKRKYYADIAFHNLCRD
jgi:hypothetical protein